MSFMTISFVWLTLGTLLILFAKRVADLGLRMPVNLRFISPAMNRLLYVWGVRLAGIAFVVFGLLFPRTDPWPWRTIMIEDENRIALLEKGETIQGKVTTVYYQHAGPKGWRIDYQFDVNGPHTDAVTTYFGSAQGPRGYYARLEVGEEVSIMYLPQNPRINCEIKYFLNNPDYRYTFREGQKLHLLDKFRDQYPVEDVDRNKWYREQWNE